MAQERQLQEILRRALLAARQSDTPGRTLQGDTPVDRFEAMLDEIGETILERQLEFTAPGGRRMVLRVAKRSVVALEDLAPNSLWVDPEQDLPDMAARALAGLFLRFSEDRGDITVTSFPSPEAPVEVLSGVTADVILTARDAVEREAEEAATAAKAERAVQPAAAAPEAAPPVQIPGHIVASSRLRAFFLASTEFSRAAAISDLAGGGGHAVGSESLMPMAAMSKGCAEQIALNRSLLDGVMPGDRLVLMGTGRTGLPSVCCVMDTTALVVATLDAASVDSALAAWAASRDIMDDA